MGAPAVWAMTTAPGLLEQLDRSGFTESSRVIAFVRTTARPLPENELAGSIAPLDDADLSEVERLDHAAFADPWRMDPEALRATYERSLQAIVLRRAGQIAGYLMASLTPHGVHITRLAVLPQEQSRGIGRALVARLLNDLLARGAPRVSVNTQIENDRSQRLYRSLGFADAGESYPVFRIRLVV
jgi:[ribosomal protein S18]-alanine N-acetyltransferase